MQWRQISPFLSPSIARQMADLPCHGTTAGIVAHRISFEKTSPASR
jgi:hypothetical protein